MYENLKEYKLVKIIHKNFKPGKPNVNGSYSKKRNAIILYDRFFTLDEITQTSILEHEYGHYIWHKMPLLNRIVWEGVSNGDLIPLLQKLGKTKYSENKYVTEYAKTKITEDWSECIETDYLLKNKPEYKGKSFKSFADDKMRIAKNMYDYFIKKELGQ